MTFFYDVFKFSLFYTMLYFADFFVHIYVKPSSATVHFYTNFQKNILYNRWAQIISFVVTLKINKDGFCKSSISGCFCWTTPMLQ